MDWSRQFSRLNIPSEDLFGIDKPTIHKQLVCTVFAGTRRHWTQWRSKGQASHRTDENLLCTFTSFSNKFPTNPSVQWQCDPQMPETL